MKSCYSASSTIHGRGLFAGERITKRKKIGSLRGMLIPSKLVPKNFSRHASIRIVELDNNMSLDARKINNDLCFINHSCDPNCYMRIRGTSVELYALTNILKHSELTMNYGETHHDGKLPCKCNSNNCRGAI